MRCEMKDNPKQSAHCAHILNEINDGTVAALFNLDQSKAFDRVDHYFLNVTREAAGCGEGFHIWIGLQSHSTSEWQKVHVLQYHKVHSVRLPLSPLLYGPVLEPSFLKLKGVLNTPQSGDLYCQLG